MKNSKILVGLIAAVVIVAALWALVFVRPIFPGRHVEIVYPGSGSTVPPEFSVVGVGTSWSFGIQIGHMLSGPAVYATLRGSAATLAVDGEPYESTSGGNHHVFHVKLSEGPHTIRLLTLFGEDEITVKVTDDGPLRFETFNDEERYIRAVDSLRAALSEYIRFSAGSIVTTVGNEYCRIYLTDTGAFLFFGVINNLRIVACEVRYVELGEHPVTADDITAAPVLFAWDEDAWGNRVLTSAAASGGDRLLFYFLDTDSLQLCYVFPDGRVGAYSYPLSAVAPDLPEAIADAPYIDVVVGGGMQYAVFRIYASERFYYLALNDGLLFPIAEDFGATEALFLENGSLIRGDGLYPAYEPFESLFSDRDEWAFVFPPAPGEKPAYSFMGGYVTASILGFFPDIPRYVVRPAVPDAKYDTESDYRNVGEAVCFPPGIIECIMGDIHGYFRVTPAITGGIPQ